MGKHSTPPNQDFTPSPSKPIIEKKRTRLGAAILKSVIPFLTLCIFWAASAQSQSDLPPFPESSPPPVFVTPSDGIGKTFGTAAELGDIIPTPLEVEVFNVINQARADPDLFGYGQLSPAPPLHWNAALLYIGRVHSQDLIDDNYFEHDSYNRVDGQLEFECAWYERIRTVYTAPWLAENIAGTSRSAWGVVQLWMDSQGHRNNIMDPNLSEGAIGIAIGGPYGRMWTHDFGGGRTISYNLAVAQNDIVFDPPIPQEGEQVTITVTVSNIANTDAYPVEVAVYRGNPDAGGILIDTIQQAAPICQAGGSVSVQVSLDTQNLPQATEIHAVVDPNGLFNETTENDNRAYRSLVLEIPLPGDFNTDGVIDWRDLFLLSARWHSIDPSYKLDNQDQVTGGDLLPLLRMWHVSRSP